MNIQELSKSIYKNQNIHEIKSNLRQYGYGADLFCKATKRQLAQVLAERQIMAMMEEC
jgi:N-acetyl-anhydromuramyl-L-alanine amidase AmpD